MRHFFSHLGETNPASLAARRWRRSPCSSLGKMLLPNRPVALFVVVGGIAAAALLGLGERGVKLLGEVPQGLPAPRPAGRASRPT